ncbi:MAG: glycosyltransferase family 4 protein, partial [Mariprofundaceae bacterium]|nr:glycosyltransferase family 4 protein [Mariprofundaceae bacterium]
MGHVRHFSLIIYGSLETLSGGYYYDRQLVRVLRERGHRVRVFSLPGGSYPRQLQHAFSPSWRRQLRAAAGEIDAWIIDELCHPTLAWGMRTLPGRKVVLVHHLRVSEQHPALWRPLYRFVERRFLRQAEAFLFNSHTTRESVKTLLKQSLPPSVVAWPAADRFQAAITPQFVQRRAHSPGPLRVLFIGNLIPRKGLDVLLQAMQYLAAEQAVLDVVGDARMDKKYAQRVQAAAAALQGRVRFHGRLENVHLQALLTQAHTLVVPSRYEGFGIVFMEGMAFGLPVIGSARGGAREILTPGEDGWLFLRQRLMARAADE